MLLDSNGLTKRYGYWRKDFGKNVGKLVILDIEQSSYRFI